MNVYDTLKRLGLELPPPPPKGGIYKPVKQVGSLLYVSGQGPTHGGVPVLQGKLGQECSIEQGQEAACLCTLNALSVLQEHVGDLNKIKSLVKTLAFVASADNFNQQPVVANGASQLLQELFGEEGVGARSAIGVNELPGNIPVEIEFIFEM